MLEQFYETIEEMPIKNWFNCIEKDKTWCLLNRKKDEVETDKHLVQFEKLYCEFIDTFGINAELKEIILLQNQIMCLKIDMAETGDKTIKNLIKVREIDLEDLMKENSGGSTRQSIIAVEKWLGFQIDENKVTVVKFYDYLEAIKQDNGRG